MVAGGSEPYVAPNRVWLRLREEFGQRFPGVLPSRSVPAEFPLALAYLNAMAALEQVEGDISGEERRFMAAGARTLEDRDGADPT